MNRALHKDNTDNGFVGGVVNEDMLADPTFIPHLDVLLASIAQRFGFNPVSLQRFILASNDDELHELPALYLHVQALNASKIHYMCQVLLRSEPFDHYISLLRRMSALIRTAKTGKRQTIISLIAGSY